MDKETEILNQFSLEKLTIKWEVSKLQQEVNSISEDKWLFHHDTDHEHIIGGSGWFDISLTSSTGSYKDDHSLRTAPIENCNIITDLCETTPYIKTIIDFFQPVTRCRLFKLKKQSIIKDHTDDNLLDYKLARLVIPIVSDKNCYTIMNANEKYILHPGECWFMNDAKLHRIENNSHIDRVVLVVQTFDLKKIVSYLPKKEMG